MLCLAIGLFFSSLFNYHRTAMSMAILFFALSFVLAIVIEFVGNIEFLNFLTPFRYFFAPYVVTNGISSVYLLLSLFFTGVFVFLTYKLFEKRDIHC
jgi:ABC-2 type transport system permease protein